MSTTALQRVMVRMLYDPAFRERVYASDAPLAGLDLPARAHAWLVRPDRRAWATDSHRRARTLTALLGELPLASAVAASTRGAASALDEFFSSEIFHRGIQEGLSLAGMFAAWLE
ncbi:MAG TPA: hypothetical protein VMV18_05355, partial [bacterium]|nr:hypothetical protein [bacterium]